MHFNRSYVLPSNHELCVSVPLRGNMHFNIPKNTIKPKIGYGFQSPYGEICTLMKKAAKKEEQQKEVSVPLRGNMHFNIIERMIELGGERFSPLTGKYAL